MLMLNYNVNVLNYKSRGIEVANHAVINREIDANVNVVRKNKWRYKDTLQHVHIIDLAEARGGCCTNWLIENIFICPESLTT